MFADNEYDFGLLANADNMDGKHLHNDLYHLFDNRQVR